MKTQFTHTPLPWKVYYAKNNGNIVLGTGEMDGQAIQSHNGAFWRDEEESKSNAEFVVKACNAHYELVEALEIVKHNIGQVSSEEGDDNDRFLSACENVIDGALAKARGEL